MPEKWWLAFNDAALNRLIDQALSENFTLSAVFNRLEQFRAIAKINGAELIPQLNGEFSASERSDTRLSTNNYLFGLAASYELDLWGRIRANIHAAKQSSGMDHWLVSVLNDSLRNGLFGAPARRTE